MRRSPLRLVLPLLAAAGAALASAPSAPSGPSLIAGARAGGPPPLPGQELGTQPGAVDPSSFASSDVCRNCHFSGVAGESAYMPSDTWAGTMMANSMRDPVFHAALTVANQDVPGIGTFCLRCHSPLSYVRGTASADPSGATSFADPIDAHGVSCEACHRMVEDPQDDGVPYLIGDARIHVDATTAKRGPYISCQTAPDDPACSQSPGHDTLQAPSLSSAALCGQCHQATLPGRKLRDAEGVPTEHDFPIDTTYAEWSASVFAQPGDDARTCQGCHMGSDIDGPVCNIFGAVERQGPPQHAFVGGNHWGIRAVMEAAPDRVELYPNAFAIAQERTLAMLQSAATVAIVASDVPAEPGAPFSVSIRVENLSGHKFPTGHAEARRAWVAVSFVMEGDEVFVLGGYDAGSGAIEAEGDTRVYRARHGQWSGGEAVADDHLALHDVIVEDSRIPPRGFVASPTTMPVGPIDFADGSGGLRHFDEAKLEGIVPDGLPGGTATLRVTLFYQSMTREHVDFLAGANTTDQAGERLQAIFEATDEAPPLVVDSDSIEVELRPGGGGSGGGATGATSSSAASGQPAASTGAASGGGTPFDEESQGAVGDDGCGCRTAGAPAGGGPAHGGQPGGGQTALIAAVALGLVGARRRRAARHHR